MSATAAAVAFGDDTPRVEEIRDTDTLSAVLPEWEVLYRSTAAPFMCHPEFVRLWVTHFAPKARLRVLALREADGELAALLPLVEQRESFYGLPARHLASVSNSQSGRFELVARDADRAARYFLRHLRRDRGWDVLRLAYTPREGKASALATAAADFGMPVGRWSSTRPPYIPLPDSAEALRAGLSRKLRGNLRRRWKQLRQLGQVRFERLSQGPSVRAALSEGLRLEAAGWKGRRGSAITQNASTLGFYTDLVQSAEKLGVLSLYRLRLDGRTIAFRLGVEHRGCYLLFKSAYDETLSRYSPGQLLMDAMLEDCIERDLHELDLLGDNIAWKRHWTQHTRQQEWLYLFRPGATGRLLHQTKFRAAPALRRQLQRWRRDGAAR